MSMSKRKTTIGEQIYEPEGSPDDFLFELCNDPPPAPAKPPDPDLNGRQKVLFSGLDCLPGQQDLFPTDGVRNAEEEEGDYLRGHISDSEH